MIWGLKADFKNDFFLMIAQSKEFKRDYSGRGTSPPAKENAVAVSQVLGTSAHSIAGSCCLTIRKEHKALSLQICPLSSCPCCSSPAPGCPPSSLGPETHLLQTVFLDCAFPALLVLTVCTLPCPFSSESFSVLY